MPDYKKQIQVHLQEKLFAQLNDFASMSACAGIKNNETCAVKMAINHFGNGDNPVRRPWLDYATGSGDNMKNYERRLWWTVYRSLKDSSPTRQVKRERSFRDYSGVTTTTENITVSGRLFDSGAGTARRALKAIAEKMAANQKKSIDDMSTFEPNKPSTIKRKGGAQPLVWTKESYNSIKGWVE